MKKKIREVGLFIICCLSVSALYAQDTQTQIEFQIEEGNTSARTLKRKVAIARFSNETQYGKGIFYDKENDPMAKQALDILSAKLTSTDKFILLERSDLDKILAEHKEGSAFSGVGADYIIVGSITQFGRKNVGDANLISRTKTQVAEAGVSIRLIDVISGQVIYSEEAKGEAELKSKSTLGVGASADYDVSLSDKAISAAISKLVENVINNCMDRPWRAYFLTVDEGSVFITGGASQGIGVGDEFVVKEKGRTVKNPQTGINMELPGKTVGKVKINYTGGDTPLAEFSIVDFVEGSINQDQLEKYYIEEN